MICVLSRIRRNVRSQISARVGSLWSSWRQLSIFGEKGNAQLNDIEEINIASQRLIVIVLLAIKVSHRSSNDARKLNVLYPITGRKLKTVLHKTFIFTTIHS